MEFRILGPLEVVEEDRAVPLGGRRQRVVLARLLVRANQTVSTGTLIDEIWGEDPPEAVRNSLQSYVSHLRKALGEGRIRSGSGGYALTAEPGEIDARRFESLVEQGRAVAVTDPDAAATTFGRALALWRGPAFADLSDELSLLGEIARLDDLRLSATEHKFAAELAAGRHSANVGELEALTSRHQLRERLWAQLMLALYRSGRQGEALSAYRRAREVLAEELGIDPSPELQALYERILRQDPDLRVSLTAAATPVRRGELASGNMFAGYRVDSVLGRGGSSVVYLGEDSRLGRKVALKLLGPWLDGDAAVGERFLRESRLAASIDHPNVIPIYEAGEHDGQPFIAMRYVDGTDLRRLIDENDNLDAARTVAIVGQVAAALDAAHSRGLVHRDVKPANVLLTGENNVYLSDFGLTRRLSGDSSLGATRFAGTLDYAAPEQFEGQPLDGRADQYSLGCVLVECLTGSPPFPRANPAALMRAHLDDPPPAITETRPELSPAVDGVVARALAKKPDDRYASCGDLARAAAGALGSERRDGERSLSMTAALAAHSTTRRSRRRLVVVGAVAALVAALLATAVPRVLDGDAAASLLDYDAGMAIIDAATGEGLASIPDSVVQQPVEAIFADGYFWVLNIEPVSFVQIEPDTGRIVRQIASPIDVGSFTVDGNDLWIAHHTEPVLSRVDIRLGREVARVDDLPGEGGSGGILVADGSLWVARNDADGGLGILARLDPATFEIEHLFHRLPGSLALAYGDDGAVWTGGSWGDVNRIDPRTNTVRSVNVGGRNFYVAAGGGFGWTADEAKGVVYQIDGDGSIVAAHPTAIGARVVSYSDGVLWVGNQDDGSVSAVDASSGATTSYRFSHPIQAIAAGSGKVLVQLLPGQTFEDAITELDGEVAKLFVGGYALEPLDPALIWSDLGRQVSDATCARLLRHTEGEGLVPEVAASMPTVSDDGRTYTFTIRSGYRFSPPVDEAVTAETFLHSIERALSPGLGPDTPGRSVLSDVEGLEAFVAGTAEHVAGLRADSNTLTITLGAPSDDFLDGLAEPFFCPVPNGTPAIPGGVAVSVDGGQDMMVPSAGPYYIARHFNGEYAILLRNPNYAGPRSHRFDAIVLREGIDLELARELVESGEWDGITTMFGRDGRVEDTFSDRLGCLTPLPDGSGIDLAAICRAGES